MRAALEGCFLALGLIQAPLFAAEKSNNIPWSWKPLREVTVPAGEASHPIDLFLMPDTLATNLLPTHPQGFRAGGIVGIEEPSPQPSPIGMGEGELSPAHRETRARLPSDDPPARLRGLKPESFRRNLSPPLSQSARENEKRLSFSSEAEESVLLRRVYFDLLGVPPTPGQLAEYAADRRPRK